MKNNYENKGVPAALPFSSAEFNRNLLKRTLKACKTFEVGPENNHVYFVLDGCVSLSYCEGEQREVLVNHLSPGDFFGENNMVKSPTNLYRAYARTDCKFGLVPIPVMRTLLMRDPDLSRYWHDQIAQRLNLLAQNSFEKSYKSVRERVVKGLWRLTKLPDSISHPMGHVVRVSRIRLANMVGCSREMAGRVVCDLHDDPVISAHGYWILLYRWRLRGEGRESPQGLGSLHQERTSHARHSRPGAKT